MLVLLNPFSGRKKAPGIWRTSVQPMLDRSPLLYDFIQVASDCCDGVAYDCETQTERPGHAVEIAQSMDLDKYSALVTVSGDGLMHEVCWCELEEY